MSNPFRYFNSSPEVIRPVVVMSVRYPLSLRDAILGRSHPTLVTGPVAIVMAGTSDLPVGRETARTLAFAGQPFREYTDIGVAGLWRLLEKIEDIRSSPVVIVAAGMDAALVSVVGGLVSSPVIALPTSVGYGVAEGGATALHAALASCAPGISVVNIDNGYGAACAALRISRVLSTPEASVDRLAYLAAFSTAT
jgi:pyridinium-3,5-biscarboxylic acid mononucleotide synthase